VLGSATATNLHADDLVPMAGATEVLYA
jgi:hypothetical protein